VLNYGVVACGRYGFCPAFRLPRLFQCGRIHRTALFSLLSHARTLYRKSDVNGSRKGESPGHATASWPEIRSRKERDPVPTMCLTHDNVLSHA